MRILYLLIFSISAHALVLQAPQYQGILIEVKPEYYLIKNEDNKYIKVNPFLKRPEVGKKIFYQKKDLKKLSQNWTIVAQKLLSHEKTRSIIWDKYLETYAMAQLKGHFRVDENIDDKFTFIKHFLNSAYAQNEFNCGSSNVCWFGGWPSLMKGNSGRKYCTAPWRIKAQSKKNNFNLAYDSSSKCGRDRFRCNPKMFGTISENVTALEGVDVDASKKGSKGLCIKINESQGYKDVSIKCINAAKKLPDYKEQISKLYADNKAEYDKLKNKLDCFCSKTKDIPGYEYCQSLKEFVEKTQRDSNISNLKPDKPQKAEQKATASTNSSAESSIDENNKEAEKTCRFLTKEPDFGIRSNEECLESRLCVWRVSCKNQMTKKDEKKIVACSCNVTDADLCGNDGSVELANQQNQSQKKKKASQGEER